MGVFLVPNRHRNPVTGGVRECQKQSLAGFQPNGKPVAFVVPHVHRPTDNITGVDFLPRRVDVVGLNFFNHLNALTGVEPRLGFVKSRGGAHHGVESGKQQQGNQGGAHDNWDEEEVFHRLVSRV